jgi:transposase-like protein
VANKAYSFAFKAEAIALGRVLGAEVASAQLGIGGRETLRRWMEAAGDPPELQGAPGQWQRLFDLAQARAEAVLASGKLSVVQLATVMGIAQRNIREPKVEPRNEAEDAYDAFVSEIEARYPDPHQEHLALVVLIRYHQDHGCRSNDDGTYPNPCPEPLDNIWTYLDGLGDLEDWLEVRDAWEDAARERQLERIRQVREEARLAALDAETRGLVEAAEAWLAQSQETPDAA